MPSRLHPVVLTVLIAATAFAGCFADEPIVDDPPVAELPPPQVDNRTLTVRTPGCTQYSGGIVAPADDFEAFVPPGFTLVRDQQAGQLVQLALIANLCDQPFREANAGTNETGTFVDINGTGTYAVIAVPVYPADEYRDDNYTRNLAPVRLIVQDQAFADRFAEWGFDMTEVGTFAATSTPTPVGELNELQIVAGATYDTAGVLGPIGDTFARNHYRLWVHDGSNITANLLVDNMAGPRIGQGAHAWQASGDDVLPAQSSGTMTVGTDIEAYYRWIEGGRDNPGRIESDGTSAGDGA